jgi:hypothetical protein
MSSEVRGGASRPGLDEVLADGYATVHELETRTLQLERHCEELVSAGADAEQIRTVMRARRALSRELRALRARLEELRTAGA